MANAWADGCVRSVGIAVICSLLILFYADLTDDGESPADTNRQSGVAAADKSNICRYIKRANWPSRQKRNWKGRPEVGTGSCHVLKMQELQGKVKGIIMERIGGRSWRLRCIAPTVD